MVAFVRAEGARLNGPSEGASKGGWLGLVAGESFQEGAGALEDDNGLVVVWACLLCVGGVGRIGRHNCDALAKNVCIEA